MPSLNVARHSHGCVVLNNTIMVSGGIGVNGDLLDSVEIYANGAWITDYISVLPRHNFPMLSHMNMPVMFPGAPDKNDVSILIKD